MIFMYTCILYIYTYVFQPKKVFPGGLQLFSLRRGMLYNGLHIWNSIMCDFLCVDWDFVVLCFSDSPHLNFWRLWSHVWMDSGHDKQCCTFYLRWVTRGFAFWVDPWGSMARFEKNNWVLNASTAASDLGISNAAPLYRWLGGSLKWCTHHISPALKKKWERTMFVSSLLSPSRF